MTITIDYFGGLSSPWTYLGHSRLREIANTHGAKIHFKPVDLQRIFTATGGLPLDKRPAARRAYRMQELIRWRDATGIELHLEPKYFPVPHTKGALLIIAAEQAGHPVMDLAYAFMKAVWMEQRNIDDEETVIAIANEQGLDGTSLFMKSNEPDTIAIYEKYTDEALDKGVFGAPTYVIDNDLFWGQDRLDFVERKLKEVGGN